MFCFCSRLTQHPNFFEIGVVIPIVISWIYTERINTYGHVCTQPTSVKLGSWLNIHTNKLSPCFLDDLLIVVLGINFSLYLWYQQFPNQCYVWPFKWSYDLKTTAVVIVQLRMQKSAMWKSRICGNKSWTVIYLVLACIFSLWSIALSFHFKWIIQTFSLLLCIDVNTTVSSYVH